MKSNSKHSTAGIDHLKAIWNIGKSRDTDESSQTTANESKVSIYDTPNGGRIPPRLRKKKS